MRFVQWIGLVCLLVICSVLVGGSHRLGLPASDEHNHHDQDDDADRYNRDEEINEHSHHDDHADDHEYKAGDIEWGIGERGWLTRVLVLHCGCRWTARRTAGSPPGLTR